MQTRPSSPPTELGRDISGLKSGKKRPARAEHVYNTIDTDDDPYATVGRCGDPDATIGSCDDPYATIGSRDDTYATMGSRANKRNTRPGLQDKNEDVYATIGGRDDPYATIGPRDDPYATIGPRDDPYATIDPRAKKSKTLPLPQDKIEDVYATIDPRTKKRKNPSVLQDKNEDVYATVGPRDDVYARMTALDTVYPTSGPDAFKGKSQKGNRPPPLPPKPPKPSMVADEGEIPPPIPWSTYPGTTPYETMSPTSPTGTPYEELSPISPRSPRKNAASAFFGKDFKPFGAIPALPPRAEPPKAPITVFGSGNVYNLSMSTYDGFIRDKEKALVIFYDTKVASFASLAKEFGHAADKAKHDNHCYGAVDCGFHKPLCCQEQITRTPALKLYSNGYIVGTMNEASSFKSDQINQMVTMSPVLTQPRGI